MEDIVKAQNTFAIKVGEIGWYIGTRTFRDVFIKAMSQVAGQDKESNYKIILNKLWLETIETVELEALRQELERIENRMMNYKSVDVSRDINDNYEAHWKDNHQVTHLGNSFITRMGDNVFDEFYSAIYYALENDLNLKIVDIQSGFLAGVDQSQPSDEVIDMMVKTIEAGDTYQQHSAIKKEFERFVLPKFNQAFSSLDLVDQEDKLVLRRYFDHKGMVHMQIEFD